MKDPEEILIVAECILAELYSKEKDKKKAYTIISKCKGKDLVGLRYEPLFDCFADREKDGCFSVIAANYVTKDSGTGIVH
jgi:isoleucyl-tRNA synthetase